MSQNKQFRFSIAGQPLYPHIKLTGETFPRLLATRKIESDNAEYFGPFLTRSTARILIDFLNQTFRLRTCYIEIDGNFEVPCTQYYSKRCVAPCVKSLCGRAEYFEVVELARLFLGNKRKSFESEIISFMGGAAGREDFERALFFRNVCQNVNSFWQDKRRQVWLDDAVDTFILEENSEDIKIFLVTTRRMRMLGSRVFVFESLSGVPPEQALADVIQQFYRFNTPREIRVSRDFPQRRELSQRLSQMFRRNVKIVVLKENSTTITAIRALGRTQHEDDLKNLSPKKNPSEIQSELKKIFGLKTKPARIEAFDVAHISGNDLAAAVSVWQNGRFIIERYKYRFFEGINELETLYEFTAERFLRKSENLPDLLIIDGGLSHLKAALKGVGNSADRRFIMIAAVKPRGKHSDISHFIMEDGRRIEFDANNKAMRVLQILRDEAHELANSAHRQSRDMGYFYELAAILPSLNENERQMLLVKFGSIKKILEIGEFQLRELFSKEKVVRILLDQKNNREGKSRKIRPPIIPIRYDDPNGDAGDLRPIKAH